MGPEERVDFGEGLIRCVLVVNGEMVQAYVYSNFFLTVGELNTEFEIFGNKYSCHNGMLESANWLGYEGKMIQYTKELFNRSYKIVLTGHSLGAGICVLLALILRKEIPDLMPVVYAYAPPPCVSAALAEKCKSELIICKGLINRDDFVCRASAANARALASEIKARRQQWEPFLRRDFSDVYKRTLTLWAPMRRTKRPIEETNNDDNTIDDNNSGNSKNATKSQRTKSRSSSTEILSLANVTVNVNEKDKTKTVKAEGFVLAIPATWLPRQQSVRL